MSINVCCEWILLCNSYIFKSWSHMKYNQSILPNYVNVCYKKKGIKNTKTKTTPNYTKLEQTTYFIISYQAKHIRDMVTYVIEKYSQHKRNTIISYKNISTNLSWFLNLHELILACSESDDWLVLSWFDEEEKTESTCDEVWVWESCQLNPWPLLSRSAPSTWSNQSLPLHKAREHILLKKCSEPHASTLLVPLLGTW